MNKGICKLGELESWRAVAFFTASGSWEAELLAIKLGVERTLEEGISYLDIESDPELIIEFLNKEETPPWSLLNLKRSIWN